MKNILLVIAVLFVGACATTPTMKSVAGAYERKDGGNTIKSVLMENGIYKEYNNGKTDGKDYKWKISKDGEVHIDNKFGDTTVFKINPAGSLTVIANIHQNGKRTDVSKDEQLTWEKIK